MSFFLYLPLGLTVPGEPALKKRQKTNGRNYRIQVPRPKIIEDYQRNMGYVDRHNRFRMDILGLARVWKTKKWQSRMIVEILGMAIVDSFLLARKFMPAYISMTDIDSTFWQFVTKLLPQIYPEREGRSTVEVDQRVVCTQIKLPSYTVASGKHAGRVKTKQQRCVYCVKHKRVGSDKRAIRTSWTCICHPEHYCCKKSECWIEHLADNECGDTNEVWGAVIAQAAASNGDSGSDVSPPPRTAPRKRSRVIPRIPRAAGVELPLSQPAPTLRSSDRNLNE